MNTFIMMMGISGSGKSTFIRNNNLENYTVSPDTLRKATGGLSTNPDGTKTTTQEFDSLIWPFIYDVLDKRMSKGMFTVFDATNCSQRTVQETKGKRSEVKLPKGKIGGYYTNDKVLYRNRYYFIKGLMTTGYAMLMNIHGIKQEFEKTDNYGKTPKLKDMKRISARKTTLVDSGWTNF